MEARRRLFENKDGSSARRNAKFNKDGSSSKSRGDTLQVGQPTRIKKGWMASTHHLQEGTAGEQCSPSALYPEPHAGWEFSSKRLHPPTSLRLMKLSGAVRTVIKTLPAGTSIFGSSLRLAERKHYSPCLDGETPYHSIGGWMSCLGVQEGWATRARPSVRPLLFLLARTRSRPLSLYLLRP